MQFVCRPDMTLAIYCASCNASEWTPHFVGFRFSLKKSTVRTSIYDFSRVTNFHVPIKSKLRIFGKSKILISELRHFLSESRKSQQPFIWGPLTNWTPSKTTHVWIRGGAGGFRFCRIFLSPLLMKFVNAPFARTVTPKDKKKRLN
jgi:hypothetical protein